MPEPATLSYSQSAQSSSTAAGATAMPVLGTVELPGGAAPALSGAGAATSEEPELSADETMTPLLLDDATKSWISLCASGAASELAVA